MKEINIGKKILINRKERGITQDELAEYIGVSKASVSKWETGQSYPDITFLPLLAAYFNISIDELIGYEPQMIEKDVKELYQRLSDAFAYEDFDHVMEEINTYIKKYYSCYILQYYMAQLLLNYSASITDINKQADVVRQVDDICGRIVEESGDIRLSRLAVSIQAFAALMLKKPDRVISLLEDELQPENDNRTLIANAYLMKGDKVHSNQTLQFSMFECLLKMLSNLQIYLYNNIDQPELFETILDRCEVINQTFGVEEFHQNVMAQVYLTAAIGYMMQKNDNRAMDMLENYSRVCNKFRYPVHIHGDDFFYLVDEMFEEYNVGNIAPRNEKVIKESIRDAVLTNPVFAPLSGISRYQTIINRLKNI